MRRVAYLYCRLSQTSSIKTSCIASQKNDEKWANSQHPQLVRRRPLPHLTTPHDVLPNNRCSSCNGQTVNHSSPAIAPRRCRAPPPPPSPPPLPAAAAATATATTTTTVQFHLPQPSLPRASLRRGPWRSFNAKPAGHNHCHGAVTLPVLPSSLLLFIGSGKRKEGKEKREKKRGNRKEGEKKKERKGEERKGKESKEWK